MAGQYVKHDQLNELIDFLKAKADRQTDVSISELMDHAEIMASSIGGVVESIDQLAFKDLSDICREIASMKEEVRNLRVGEMKSEHIPTAGQELDAIVDATETATDTIMEAAEEIMAGDTSDVQAYQDMVNDKMLAIFEACAFQDITGQRVSKVVRTLNFIDERVSKLADRLSEAFQAPEHQPEETDDERRRRELLLNGPQLKGDGVNQDDVDSMFN